MNFERNSKKLKNQETKVSAEDSVSPINENLFFVDKKNFCLTRTNEPLLCIIANTEDRRSSKEERRADALALGADERRDKLRKAAVRSKYPVTRRCLNGETRQEKLLSSIRQSITYGGEPGELKHLSTRRKRKQKERKFFVIS